MKRKIIRSIFTLAIMGAANAQTFQYDNLTNNSNAFYPSYRYTEQGATSRTFTYSYEAFRFSVKNGTGSASFLNGNDYIGFCVNPVFNFNETDDIDTFSATPNLLSYDVGNGDYWSVNRGIKFDAMANTLAFYSGQLTTLDPNSQAYAELVTGINISFTEIVVDYDGTLASIDLNSGNAMTRLDAAGTPITSGASFAVYEQIRDNLIGTGDGGSFQLFTATAPDDSRQDLVFFSAVPIPEPSSTALLGLGGFALLLRRKR